MIIVVTEGSNISAVLPD